VFDSAPPFRAHEIKPEAIPFRVDSRNQLASKRDPLRLIDYALEDRELDPLAMILTGLGNFAQTPAASIGFRLHVVRN
jgi:hypothetical protein